MDLVDHKQVGPKEAYMKSVDKGGMVGMLKAKGDDVAFLNSMKE